MYSNFTTNNVIDNSTTTMRQNQQPFIKVNDVKTNFIGMPPLYENLDEISTNKSIHVIKDYPYIM